MAIPAATIRSRVKPDSSPWWTRASQVDETLNRLGFGRLPTDFTKLPRGQCTHISYGVRTLFQSTRLNLPGSHEPPGSAGLSHRGQREGGHRLHALDKLRSDCPRGLREGVSTLWGFTLQRNSLGPVRSQPTVLPATSTAARRQTTGPLCGFEAEKPARRPRKGFGQQTRKAGPGSDKTVQTGIPPKAL
jgi:hypothetical protein